MEFCNPSIHQSNADSWTAERRDKTYPKPVSFSNQCSLFFSSNTSSMIFTISLLLATRAAFEEKRGSEASVGWDRISLVKVANCQEDMSNQNTGVREWGEGEGESYLALVADSDHEEAVLAGEDLVRHDRRMSRSLSRAFLSRNKVVGRDVREASDLQSGPPCMSEHRME